MVSSIEIYTSPDNQSTVNVRFEGETVWLNRHQLSELFDRDIKTIGKHINNVFAEGELEEHSVVAKFATTANDGKVYQMEHYSLDVIISVGYRVKSVRGTQFRQWATRRLKDVLVQGYALNEQRLADKQMEVVKNIIIRIGQKNNQINSFIGSAETLVCAVTCGTAQTRVSALPKPEDFHY